jgi:hypothetical protein
VGKLKERRSERFGSVARLFPCFKALGAHAAKFGSLCLSCGERCLLVGSVLTEASPSLNIAERELRYPNREQALTKCVDAWCCHFITTHTFVLNTHQDRTE